MQTYSIPQNAKELLSKWREVNHGYWNTHSFDTVARTLTLYEQKLCDHPESLQAVGLSAADILVSLRMDHETVVASLLLTCDDVGRLDLSYVQEHFGQSQVQLLQNVMNFERFGALYEERSNDQNRLEDLRKLFMSMAQDIRAVIAKIAYRLAQLRKADNYSQGRRYQLAREIMDIYAPLANRLGIGQVKWEMEDLAFKTLEPETYKRIAKALAEKRQEREEFIDIVTKRVESALALEEIPCKVYGRAKHIYSIWRKMHKKQLSFEELFDVRAVRVTTDSIENCYRTLTVVHSLWRDIPKEFDDYISNPKPNGYQSLHTAVIGPFGRAVEIQIRTEDMHEHAERGVAAHWRYKEGGKSDTPLEKQISWIRDLLEHKDSSLTSDDLIELFKSELSHERIYVITPKGDVLNLPKPCTPLDFAYYVHTDIGHRCRGARVNGRIASLTRELQSGDRVEVMTAQQSAPSRDWLQPNLGYLKTPRARSKVRHWFREQNKQAAIKTGRESLEQSFKRLNLAFDQVAWDAIANEFNFRKADSLFAAYANDEVGFNRILAKLPSSITASVIDTTSSSLESALKIKPNTTGKSESINVQGVGNLMVQMANCCKPVPPDPIIGFITLSRGINVHRQDCSNLLNMETFHKERFISISWEGDRSDVYPVDIRITALSRPKLFHDISKLMGAEDIDILALNTEKDKTDDTILCIQMQVEVNDLYELNRLIEKLNQLSGILSVLRLSTSD